MKKRILGVLLVLSMLLCLMPASVFAAQQTTDTATEEALFTAVKGGAMSG